MMSVVVLPQHKVFTYLFSIISSSFFVLSNLILGWGEELSLRVGFVPVFVHNVLDIFISRLWITDIPMLAHHLMVILGVYFFYHIHPCPQSVLDYGKWIALAEISSFFNGVRFFYKRSPYQFYADASFGLIFLCVRTISSIGIIHYFYTYPHIEYKYVLAIFSVLYIFLNSLWFYQIIIQSRRISPAISRLCSRLKDLVLR
jgi:hypothetical protein